MTSNIASLHSLEKNDQYTEVSSFSAHDFRTQVEGGWSNVYPSVKQRMDKLLTSVEPVIFEGTGCVRRSKIGWLFAKLSWVFGTPLISEQDENTKTVVTVIPRENGLRCWHRLFLFSDGSEQLVQTSKVMDSKLGFIDVVGSQGEKRLATKMHVWAKDKSLFFESSIYILRFKYFNLPIPPIFTPGKLFAEHRDLGNGNFRYILKFNHPLWGETFYQDGIFKMLNEEPKHF